MDATLALSAVGEPVATRSQLLAAGATPRDLTSAVRGRRLLRVREGYYALPDADPMLLQAVRIGGRLGCVSALQRHGVWTPPHSFPHVAVNPNASRLRSPRDRFRALETQNRDGCEVHWAAAPDTDDASVHTCGIVNALAQAVRCQPAEFAIAALDSALYQRLVSAGQIAAMFATLPKRFTPLRSLIEPKCMSGIETIIRLSLIDLNVPFEVQVRFDGVGVVDFVVAGCVIVEVDGREYHEGEVPTARDYARDAELAARGYTVVRLNYRQVMFERGLAIAAIVGALRSHRRGPQL
jgi:very-short-patch-repair endonuclease